MKDGFQRDIIFTFSTFNPLMIFLFVFVFVNVLSMFANLCVNVCVSGYMCVSANVYLYVIVKRNVCEKK